MNRAKVVIGIYAVCVAVFGFNARAAGPGKAGVEEEFVGRYELVKQLNKPKSWSRECPETINAKVEDWLVFDGPNMNVVRGPERVLVFFGISPKRNGGRACRTTGSDPSQCEEIYYWGAGLHFELDSGLEASMDNDGYHERGSRWGHKLVRWSRHGRTISRTVRHWDKSCDIFCLGGTSWIAREKVKLKYRHGRKHLYVKLRDRVDNGNHGTAVDIMRCEYRAVSDG